MGVSKSKSGVSSEFFLSEDAVLFFFERDLTLLHHVRIVVARGEVFSPFLGVVVQTFLGVGAICGHVRPLPERFALFAEQFADATGDYVFGMATTATIFHIVTSC